LLAHLVHNGGQGLRPPYIGVLALALAIWLVVFRAFGLDAVQHLPASEELKRLISAVSVGIVLVMVFGAWSNESMSRVWLVWTWLFALNLELFARRVVRWFVRRGKKLGRLAYRTLVVGTNDEAARVARILAPPVRGFRPLGYVTTSSPSPSQDGLPVLGSLDTIEEAILEHAIECVFVASTAVSDADLMRVSRACRRTRVEMRISANLPQILTTHLAILQIAEVMAVAVRPTRMDGGQRATKRLFDLLAGSVLLMLTLPMILPIALTVRLTSRGPILFRQQRMTKAGRVFTMFKFRTMIMDADTALTTTEIVKPFFKLENDPRLTKVGRFLRSYSLDELPQLWNVLRGHMSLVGPRPLRIEQIAADREQLTPRHEVKSGLTGWWQINGRSDVPYEQALKMDLFYIENWSLSLDLYIILKTVGVLIAGRGAY
jgi:exopolysaccharide biosynthesis polyprenyl glycosylphosphotransferase